MKNNLLVVLILATITITGCGLNSPASGTRNGQIVMLKKEGIFSKTWECEILKGGMNNGSGSFGQPFYFTVESESDAKLLQAAMDSQQEIIIHYHKAGFYWCVSSASEGDFMDSFQVVTNK